VSLGEAGVVAALRELGDHTSAPLLVHDDLARTVPLPAGMAIYQLVLDASRLGRTASVLRVDLADAAPLSARVTVTVEVPDPVGAGIDDEGVSSGQRLVHAEDRFLALGGSLHHTGRRGVLAWEGIAPCG
jgi:hypothetical protein